jgi:mannose-6-phosphate isomerase-like protein (cupin superfamily)
MNSQFLFAALAASYLFLFSGTLPVKTAGSEGAADTSRYTIDNCINVFREAGVESTKAGYQYWFADRKFADGKTLKLSVVRPHQATHPPHHHPEDEFFFILEGKAEFYLDGRTKIVGPYTSLYCPSNSEHGIRNAGNSELRYLVIKKYPTE